MVGLRGLTGGGELGQGSTKLLNRIANLSVSSTATKAENRVRRATNYQKSGALRRRALQNILDTVERLGVVSSTMSKRASDEELAGNELWRAHRGRVRGAVERFKRSNPFLTPLPLSVVDSGNRAAFLSTEGKRG